MLDLDALLSETRESPPMAPSPDHIMVPGLPGRELRQLVRARAGGDPFPRPDGSVPFVPVLGEAT